MVYAYSDYAQYIAIIDSDDDVDDEEDIDMKLAMARSVMLVPLQSQ